MRADCRTIRPLPERHDTYPQGGHDQGEIRRLRLGMIPPALLAIQTAYFSPVAVTLCLPGGKLFYWEPAMLVVIVLSDHWPTLRPVSGTSRAQG